MIWDKKKLLMIVGALLVVTFGLGTLYGEYLAKADQGDVFAESLAAAGTGQAAAGPEKAVAETGQNSEVSSEGGELSAIGADTAKAAPNGASSAKININTASEELLDSLPGIGPAKASAIINYRNEHGPFTSIKELTDVSGIGEVTYEKLKGLICVD